MLYTGEQREQITVDYQRAIRNCNDAAWDKMTVGEKIQDMQSIENYHAMQQNRIAADVSATSMQKGMHGYQAGNSIVVSEADIKGGNYKECIDTVYHEGEHCYFWQGEIFTGVRQQMEHEFTSEQLEQIQSPVPDAREDFNSYYQHLNEISARAEGQRGVTQIREDQTAVKEVDANMPHQNQVLETYDYDALSIASYNQCELTASGKDGIDDVAAGGEVSADSMDMEGMEMGDGQP